MFYVYIVLTAHFLLSIPRFIVIAFLSIISINAIAGDDFGVLLKGCTKLVNALEAEYNNLSKKNQNIIGSPDNALKSFESNIVKRIFQEGISALCYLQSKSLGYDDKRCSMVDIPIAGSAILQAGITGGVESFLYSLRWRNISKESSIIRYPYWQCFIDCSEEIFNFINEATSLGNKIFTDEDKCCFGSDYAISKDVLDDSESQRCSDIIKAKNLFEVKIALINHNLDKMPNRNNFVRHLGMTSVDQQIFLLREWLNDVKYGKAEFYNKKDIYYVTTTLHDVETDESIIDLGKEKFDAALSCEKDSDGMLQITVDWSNLGKIATMLVYFYANAEMNKYRNNEGVDSPLRNIINMFEILDSKMMVSDCFGYNDFKKNYLYIESYFRKIKLILDDCGVKDYFVVKKNDDTYVVNENVFISLWFSNPSVYGMGDDYTVVIDNIMIDICGMFIYALLTSNDQRTFIEQIYRYRAITTKMMYGYGDNPQKLYNVRGHKRYKQDLLERRFKCCMDNISDN